LSLKLKDVIQEIAKKSYESNVGRPKSKQELVPINKVNTNEELGKIAGVSKDDKKQIEQYISTVNLN